MDRRTFLVNMALVPVTALDAKGQPTRTPLPLGQPSFCVKVAALPSAYRSSTDFSCWTWNEAAKAMQFFSGGGHAAHWHTAINSYDPLPGAWRQEYPSTPLADMIGANVLMPSKFWKTTGHPQSTHTYARGFIYSHALQDMVLMAGAAGEPAAFQNNMAALGFVNSHFYGGNIGHYKSATKTWEDSGVDAFGYLHGFAEDRHPTLGGNILSMNESGFSVYDPRQRKMVNRGAWSRGELSFEMCMAYYPPTDKFYYFSTLHRANTELVFEIALDRTTWTPIFTPRKDVRGRSVEHLDLPARPGRKWGLIYVYDSANELLIGGIVGGKAYGFDPRTRAWTMMALDAPGLTGLTFYCHDYIPDHNIHVMISAGNIYAFRWGNSVPAPSVPPSPPPGSKATITIKGNNIASLQ